MPIVFSSTFPLFSEGVVNRKVFGIVLGVTGEPLEDVTVQIQTQGLNGELVPMGEPETDASGRYEFTFDPESYNPKILKVSLPSVSGSPSEVVVSPAWNEQVDFRLGTLPGARVPRFTDVGTRLSQVLSGSQLTLSNLDATGVARTSIVSGVPPRETALVRDAELSSALSEVPASLFYALGRSGLSGAVADVIKHSPEDRALALRKALASGALSPEDQEAAEAAMADLNEVMVASALQAPQTIASPGLALTLAGVTDANVRAATIEAWIAHTGEVDTFWSGLSGLTTEQKADAQFALGLDKLTRSNATLVQALFAEHETLADLASLEPADWEALAETHDVPAFFNGVTTARYAQAMFTAVEDGFPTQMLSARHTWFGPGVALKNFLDGNPEYDLAGKSFRQFILENPTAIEAAGNAEAQAAVMAEVPILERLYRIAPRTARFEVVRDLREAGIVSATQIQLMGRTRFMDELAEALGSHAEGVYLRAKALSSVALMLQSVHGSAASYSAMPVLPVRSEDPLEGSAVPLTWSTLFGGRSACACRECQSAYGPSAYLADLLFWLWARGVDGTFTDVLLARRPDIAAIELSCKNSHTALPTIDLIIERLEHLAQPAGAPGALQTSLDEGELAARPEHVHEPAYLKLAGVGEHSAVYPFEQPYVAPLDRTRTFLQSLGVSRAGAMSALHESGGGSGALEVPEIAAETLGMTRTSWEFLAGSIEANTAARWGFRSELLGAHPSWAEVGAPETVVAPAEPDPDGGNLAVELEDASGAAATAWQVADTRYRGGPFAGSLHVKKDTGATAFVQVVVGVDGDYADEDFAFFLDQNSGSVSGGDWIVRTATDAGDWWLVEFAHVGTEGAASSLGVRVLPAAGSSYPTPSAAATGSVTLYNPRVASTRDVEILAQVTTFLQQGAHRGTEHPLTYAELEDLLRSRYVQDAGELGVWFDNLTCDIEGAELRSAPGLAAHLDRLAKLIRLSRDIGWTIRDTDRAIEIFRTSESGSLLESDVSEDLLLALGALKWLEGALRVSPAVLLDWFGPLDTRRWNERVKDGTPAGATGEGRGRIPDLASANAGGAEAEPSPFQRLARLHGASALFAVTDSGTELVNASYALTDHLDAVSALVGSSRADLAPFVAALPLTGDPPIRALTLANVSQLYRQVALTKALGLGVAELLTWQERLAILDPFASPGALVDLVVELRRQGSVRVSPDAMDAMLAPRGTRDLEAMGLPSAGEALLALAEDVRAHRAPRTNEVFDVTQLDEHNLLAAPGELEWTPTNASVATEVADPLGGATGVEISDSSAAEVGLAVTPAVTEYTSLTPVWVSLWVRKEPAATHFAEVGIQYGSTVVLRLALDPRTGHKQVQDGSADSIEVQDAGLWWMLSLRHAGSDLGAPKLVVYPAAGTVGTDPEFPGGVLAQGTIAVYGARLAVARIAAADPGYSEGARLDPASPRYQHAARDRAVIRRLASLLDLDPTLASRLVRVATYTYVPAIPPEETPAPAPVLDVLLGMAEALADARAARPSATAAPEDLAALVSIDAWELTAILGWLCRALTFSVEDLSWLFEITGVRGFDVETIVLAETLSARYAAWASLREAARLQRVGRAGRLFELLGTLVTDPPESPGALRTALAVATEWDEADLAVAILDSPAYGGPLGGDSPASWASPERFARLARWMELARSLRAPASRLFGGSGWGDLVWPATPSTTEPVSTYVEQAAQLEAAVRSTWGPERWLAEMPSVRERLRERQRTALVSHVVGSNPYSFGTSSALGEHLLMDVHTAGCARTSRVKDAIRSVQVFVQRVLLGAEGELSLTEEESREWVWRKSYRVWEANRKVFLYPENWLRPELRRDKTPIFEAFETEIAGGDLSANVVEGAYREYLRKLTEVSKLDILAVHRGNEDGSDVYRVFGRTRGIPQMYFHRERRGGRWTPWREIPRAEGEHLLPVVHHRRLLLLWLSVGESSFSPNSVPVPLLGEDVVPPGKYFNIRLSWSEYRDERWSAPVKSDVAIGVDERGELRPRPAGSVSADLISMAPDFISSDAASSFNPRVIHGRVDASGRDVLVQVYRQRPDGSSALLGRFRLGGIDSHLLVESAADDVPRALSPNAAYLYPFETAAQKFFSWTDPTGDVNPLELAVALPHASATGGSHTTILAHETHIPGEWIQITPVDRVRFDATDPFVFEDGHGSYWATYRPGSFFSGIGFGGSYWPGADLDLKLDPPAASALEDASIRFSESAYSAFRSLHSTGTDALINSKALQQIRGTGKKIVAINGSAADMGARTYALSSTFEISEGGETIFGARAGVKYGADDRLGIALTYKSPTVTVSPTLFTEGFHMLRPARAMWHFETFFHPHVGVMRETLNRLGVFGLLQPPPVSVGDPEPMEGQDPQPESTLGSRYLLRRVVNNPPDDLDFSATGAYAQYNWEVFFHAPFLIATRLHEAGRFEDSIKWLRTIFDPHRAAQAGATGDLAGRSPWRFRPFREVFRVGEGLPRNIQELVALLTAAPDDDDAVSSGTNLLQQIRDWRRNPFDPHAIARTRIVTYMTSVVMKYLEVLIDWGDQLFAQDTLESIGEATEYYLLAARILGPPPETVPGGTPEADTFGEMLTDFQTGESPAAALEEVIALDAWSDAELEAAGDDATSLATLLYFCVPANPQLRSRFWDRVADRLFKVRNCLNLQGQRRELALFEPPIDPDLLVRAAASGVDLRSVMADIVTGRIPHRRYLAMADLAAGLAASANALGQALLGAIEKRDADQLNTLRAEHERRLHDDTIKARRDQITDLEHQLVAARHSRDGTVRRRDFYRSRKRSPKETMALGKSRNAKALSDVAGALSAAGAIFNLIPEIDIGVAGAGGSPMSKVAFGGKALGAFARASAQAIEAGAQAYDREGRMLLTEAGYERRQEEWVLQADLAQKDLDALEERIISTEIQLAMAKNALASAELRMQQIEEVQDFLERRFAREDLFSWLADQLSSLHYQSYQLAYEFAKKAEAAWRYELGRSDSFIQFGYWDSRRRGLLAADRLGHDLRRMQVAYTELSGRRLEVDQTFSLREIDPLALVTLQQSGTAEFTLPEAFFDLSYPGHFGRRIRAVRFTLPAVVPPNTNLPAHVELRRHWIRMTSDGTLVEGGYGNAPVSMTATSTGQRDAGVFELDFKGPRLLPFEGAGAVSKWQLNLPKAVRTFRYTDIQDVLVHVAYDAQYDGTRRDNLESDSSGPAPVFTNLFPVDPPTDPPRRRVISFRQEHGGALRRFIQAATAVTPPDPFSVSFDIAKSALPAYIADALYAETLEIVDARIVFTGAPAGLTLALNAATVSTWSGWPAAANLSAADVAAAFPAGPGHGLFGTHDLAVTGWGSFIPNDDFDILIAIELGIPTP